MGKRLDLLQLPPPSYNLMILQNSPLVLLRKGLVLLTSSLVLITLLWYSWQKLQRQSWRQSKVFQSPLLTPYFPRSCHLIFIIFTRIYCRPESGLQIQWGITKLSCAWKGIDGLGPVSGPMHPLYHLQNLNWRFINTTNQPYSSP